MGVLRNSSTPSKLNANRKDFQVKIEGIEVKPCFKCKSEDIELRESDDPCGRTWEVVCLKCGVRGDDMHRITNAIKMWNAGRERDYYDL